MRSASHKNQQSLVVGSKVGTTMDANFLIEETEVFCYSPFFGVYFLSAANIGKSFKNISKQFSHATQADQSYFQNNNFFTVSL